MKKNSKLRAVPRTAAIYMIAGIIVLASVIVFSLAACGDGGANTPHPTITFDDIDAFDEWMEAQPATAVSNPYNVKFNGGFYGSNSSLYRVLFRASARKKFINLDLSGSSLTEIPINAFYHDSAYDDNCVALTKIILPDSVTSIGGMAFRDCTNLTSINIPDGITIISSNVFDGCSSLTSIKIPDGVTSIGSFAFYYCSSLTSITIPDIRKIIHFN